MKGLPDLLIDTSSWWNVCCSDHKQTNTPHLPRVSFPCLLQLLKPHMSDKEIKQPPPLPRPPHRRFISAVSDSWITVLIEQSLFSCALLHPHPLPPPPSCLVEFLRFRLVITQRGWQVIAWREGARSYGGHPRSSSCVYLGFLHPLFGCQQAAPGLVLKAPSRSGAHQLIVMSALKTFPAERRDGAAVEG